MLIITKWDYFVFIEYIMVLKNIKLISTESYSE